MSTRLPRWVDGALGLALLAFPTRIRRRDGASLRRAVKDQLHEAGRAGTAVWLRVLAGEWLGLLRAGLGMRVGATVDVIRTRRTTMGWMTEIRIAIRGLVRSPGFTLVAVLTLALGLGANGAVFGLVQRVLLRDPPYGEPDRLIFVWRTLGNRGEPMTVPAPDAAVVEQRAASLTATAFTTRTTDATLAAPEADASPVHALMAGVTPDFFGVLGVSMALGRSAPEGEGPGDGPPAVILSDRVWRAVFGADPDLAGRTVLLNDRPVTVLGVAPPDFRLELPPGSGITPGVDVWVPIRIPLSDFERPVGRFVDQDSDNTGAVIARLAPGATLARAQADVDRIATELRAEVPSYAEAGFGLVARPLHADATAHVRGLMHALLAGAVGVFLVACLGLATLILARGLSRGPELALRSALGAGRWRLTRTLVTENVLVVLGGGVIALLVAGWSGAALTRLVPPGTTAFDLDTTAPSLAFVLGGTAAAVLVFSATAALHARLITAGADVRGALARSRASRGRVREALVVAQVAVSVVLVLGAGLLFRTARALGEVDPGIEVEGALALDLSVRVAGAYSGPAERARLIRSLEDAARALPGVRQVGVTGGLPLSGRRWSQPWGRPGEAPSQWTARRADFRTVTSGYFRAVGTRLLEGRTFTPEEDLSERQRVVVVDRTLARRLAPEGSAVGRVIGIPLDGEAVEARVVGVVETVRQHDLAVPGGEAVYVPYRQEASRDVTLVVRAAGDPAELAPAVRAALRRIEPRLAIHDTRTLSQYLDRQLAPTRFGLALLGAYAVLGLLAATLGLYGVVAWEVGRRTRDLGIRMAVGATAGRIRRSVLARGLRLTLTGLAAGVALAALAAGLLRRVVFGVAVADPAVWTGVVGTVLAVTLAAAWIPAWRAGRLSIERVLRPD